MPGGGIALAYARCKERGTAVGERKVSDLETGAIEFTVADLAIELEVGDASLVAEEGVGR